MKVITFPLRITEDKHKELKKAAHEANESLHGYIVKAAEMRVEKEKGGVKHG
jgi:predicted HicB family RNase H-like nuclease